MTRCQDMRRKRHVSRIRAVYAGEHGASKGAAIWTNRNHCIYKLHIFADGYGMELNHGPTLLGRVREAIRYKHHSIRTECSYVEWMHRFVMMASSLRSGMKKSI